jgi:hypothetical protein
VIADWPPADPTDVARAVADSVVLRADAGARAANPYYWHRAQPLLAAVLAEVDALGDAALSGAVEDLLADPRDPAGWARVRKLVAAALDGPDRPELRRAAGEVRRRSRFGYHVGADYEPTTGAGDGWRSWPATAPPRAAGTAPVVNVVIPFRDRSADGRRARNLAACLVALNDQTMARERYQVTVVESDDTPRWRELVRRHADEHLAAPSAGPFNKCWAVNVGACHTERPAPVLCVLDADALVDRDFVRRNAERFRRDGTGAFLPFRDLFYVDGPASARAVEDRCVAGRPDAATERLRGLLVHRAPGVCLWLRRDVFEAVGGMDERFEGWGREDLDFVLRVQLATAFDIYSDRMLHLHHPSPVELTGGETVNAGIPLLSWSPPGPIGRPDRYSGGG